LERDEWTCQVCSDAKSTLHVHHLWYGSKREPWDYPLDALVTLCEECHAYETVEFGQCAEALVRSLKIAGLMSSDVYELSTAFEPLSLRGMPEDTWSVIVHGIHQLVMDAYHGTSAYEDLRAAYYAALKANE
jgi:hypothetical protein